MSDTLLDGVHSSTPLASPEPLPALVSPKKKQEDSSVLKLKGLPYTASQQQVYEFFAGFNVSEVAFVYEPDGRPSGLAFAEFATREEALQAMGKKNGEYLGDRYVRLLHVPKHEMEEQVRLGTLAIPGTASKMRQRGLRGPTLDMPGGLVGDGTPPEPQGGSGSRQHPGFIGEGPGYPQQLQPGQQMPHMPPIMPGMPGPLRHGVGHHMGPGVMAPGQEMGPGNPAMGMPPHMALAYQLGNMQLGGNGPRPPGPGMGMVGMGMLPSFGTGAGVHAHAPVAVIGTQSKTIKIRGLPFRATPIDIFNFFEGYDVMAESLQLGVDALGRPSGEAWLTFTSSDEALRAVRERNRHYLGNRYLELSLT